MGTLSPELQSVIAEIPLTQLLGATGTIVFLSLAAGLVIAAFVLLFQDAWTDFRRSRKQRQLQKRRESAPADDRIDDQAVPAR